jgi:hypothetical protein
LAWAAAVDPGGAKEQQTGADERKQRGSATFEASRTPVGQFHQIKRLEQYPVDPQNGLAELCDVRVSIAHG